jgi:hypothetical protein
MPQPTPTNIPIRNGPEIVDFRPVLGFLAALANRRLRPLGHLTAEAKYKRRRHLHATNFTSVEATVF